jgi:glycosyltransferase involved in cell wall biosynthesis
MPDVLVFAALLPKLSGSKVILDLHDPMPELYMTKYSLGEGSPVIRLLKLLEKWSIKFVDNVITPNVAFRELFISRGCPDDKIYIVMNSPMEKVFYKDRPDLKVSGQKQAGQFVMMFHGGIYERHGLNTALEALASLRGTVPNIIFNVFGAGDYKTQFLKLVDEYDLNSMVKFYGPVSLEKIAQEIRQIDVGIIPNKRSPFTEINFPVRIFEYLCLGKPVIVPKTHGILDYFDEESMFFFEAGNAESLAAIIFDVYYNDERRREVMERAARVYRNYRWELQKQILVDNVTWLMRNDKGI